MLRFYGEVDLEKGRNILFDESTKKAVSTVKKAASRAKKAISKIFRRR